MSTKSSQHPRSTTPFQARHKVIVMTVIVLVIAWLAWNVLYTRVAANAPIAAPAPGVAPSTAPVTAVPPAAPPTAP